MKFKLDAHLFGKRTGRNLFETRPQISHEEFRSKYYSKIDATIVLGVMEALEETLDSSAIGILPTDRWLHEVDNWDSSFDVEFIHCLEKRFKYDLWAKEINVETVDDLIRLVDKTSKHQA